MFKTITEPLSVIHPTLKVPDLNFSQYEISLIKKMWNSLNLVESMSSNVVNRKLSMSRERPEKNSGSRSRSDSIDTFPTFRFNSYSLHNFQLKLCKNILKFEKQKSELDYNTIDLDLRPFEIENVKSDYQVFAMIQLISIIINNLEFNKELSIDFLVSLSKSNSRIWKLSGEHYRNLGESLILAINEMITRDHFSVEVELVFIKFYSKLSSLLIVYGQDPVIDLSSMGDSAFPNSENRSSSSEISIKSSQLSLYTQNNRTSSVLTNEQFNETEAKQQLRKPLSNDHYNDLDDDDDDSYNYLNSFSSSVSSTQTAKKQDSISKLNKLNPIRRYSSIKNQSIRSLPTAQALSKINKSITSSGLRAIEKSSSQDNCMIT